MVSDEVDTPSVAVKHDRSNTKPPYADEMESDNSMVMEDDSPLVKRVKIDSTDNIVPKDDDADENENDENDENNQDDIENDEDENENGEEEEEDDDDDDDNDDDDDESEIENNDNTQNEPSRENSVSDDKKNLKGQSNQNITGGHSGENENENYDNSLKEIDDTQLSMTASTIPSGEDTTAKLEDTQPEKMINDETEETGDKDEGVRNDTEVTDKIEFEKETEEDDSSITRFVFDGVNYKYKERPAVIEEKEGVIEFRVVNNDNSKEHMMILTGLKNIFQKQLPKMPREYIARLVYDRSHISIAIVKKPLTVVGGITYRPFDSREFAEIVFCAISSTEQVRGYGAHLMNHLKDYVKATSPIRYFLTYADNYAIGYFKKQGFTKEITFEKQRWMGYIKDYEGGTLMQCSILPRIRYLDAAKILLLQKAVIMKQIRATSKSHIIRPGLTIFKDIYEQREARKAQLGRKIEDNLDEDNSDNDFEANLPLIDPMDIPGLKEAGWTPEMDELARRPKRGPHFAIMQHILSEMQNHPSAWPFAQPVNKDEVPDYYDIIKEPMDLSTMEQRLEADVYTSMEEFIYDARLVFNNCRSYNNETTTYYKNATKLEKFMNNKIVEIPEYSHLID